MNIMLSVLMDAFFITLLIWCAYTDIRKRTVSNMAIMLLMCLGLAHMALIGFLDNAWWPYPAGFVLAIPFLIVWLKNGMGAGDVKLIMGIALYLGVLNMLIAFNLMVPVLIGLMFHSWIKAKTLKSAIPFAPVLALGAGGAVLLGYILTVLT